MTVLQKKEVDPTAHLSAEDVEQLGVELDAIRASIIDQRGESDAAYIRKVIATQRKLELGSRAVLLVSVFPPAWVVGTAGLAVAKIIENMEIGHNVMHGQWDWMRDPKIHSTTWEWDNASPAEQWKHSHNELHHTYTNVIGKDNDLGYGIMRVDEDQRWVPFYLAQPLWNFINACFFEYGIAAYDLELGKNLASKKRRSSPDFKARAKVTLRKIRQQVTKDYVLHPLLSGPSALPTLAANATANLVRNLWTHSVIMCGHFPEGVETFERRSINGETRGEWYLRQMLGSANISGSQGDALHDRQPLAPGRAPPVPRPAEQPVRRDRPAGPRPVRPLRPDLRHRLAAAAGRLRVEEGRPALAAQRLRRQDPGQGARDRQAGRRLARRAHRLGRRLTRPAHRRAPRRSAPTAWRCRSTVRYVVAARLLRVADAPLVAEPAHHALRPPQVGPRHAREEVVLDLEVEPAEHRRHQPPAADVA